MSQPITYRESRNMYIFKKDGIYFSLTNDQIDEMKKLFGKIEDEKK